MKEKLKTVIVDNIFINIGLILLAVSLVIFLIPAKIASGGVSGLATIVFYKFHITPGITMLILNIPIFIAGIISFGKTYGIKTLYSMIALSIYTDLFGITVGFNGITDNILLASLYGGIIAGVGIGVVMYFGGSTGGTDIVAQILNKYSKIPIGYSLMVVDAFVLCCAAAVFGAEPALYAIIALFSTGKMIDMVLKGINHTKVAYIISDKYNEIREIILYDINRGGTSLNATGLFTQNNKKVIMTVIKNREIHELRENIKLIDPDAFVIITDAHEVLGEGFKKI